jgi:uncharacterized protein YjiS (DUF1127 family)
MIHITATAPAVAPLSAGAAFRAGSRLVALLRRAVGTVLEWQQRARERQQLVAMDARLRRDLGLSNIDLWCEINKPFWRP